MRAYALAITSPSDLDSSWSAGWTFIGIAWDPSGQAWALYRTDDMGVDPPSVKAEAVPKFADYTPTVTIPS